MTDTLERCARALAQPYLNENEDWDGAPLRFKSEFRREARTVIEPLMEPDEANLDVVLEAELLAPDELRDPTRADVLMVVRVFLRSVLGGVE